MTADVIGSRQAEDFVQLRDRALASVKQGSYALRGAESSNDHRVAVTAWDEFQVLLEDPNCMPQLYWRLLAAFAPLQLRIGVGFGPVFSAVSDGSAINEVGYGPGFEAARDALSSLGNKEKESSNTKVAVRSSGLVGHHHDAMDLGLASMCNAALGPVSVLANDITENQWAVFRSWDKAGGSQTETAQQLDVSVSTVSRSLSRSRIWLISEALGDLHLAIKTYFALLNTN